MNDPQRLRDDDANPSLQELLRVGQPPRPLSDSTRRSSRQRVAALGLLPVAATLSWWPALAFGAVVGVGGSFATTLLLAPDRQAPTIAKPSEAVAAPHGNNEAHVLPPPAPPAEEQQPLPTVSSPVHSLPRVARTEASSAAPSTDDFRAELALLERARGDLASAPAKAQGALLEHELRFPGGALRIERELLLVDVLVRLGRRSEAETRAAALEKQAPQTLYRERLDHILERSQR